MTSHHIAAAPLDLLNAGRQITLVLSFTGHLDHHAVKNALRALIEVEPILGCRLTGEGKKASWERREDLSSLELITVEEGSAPDDAVKRFATDTRPDDPMMQGLLIRGEKGDTLCIRIGHAVTDAPGALALLPALADLYARYLAEPDFWPLQEGYSDRGSWQLIDSAGLIETIGTLSAASPPGAVFRGPVGTGGPAGETAGAIAMLVIGPDRFPAISEAAASRGATLTDVLLTAFFRALCDTLHPPEEVPLPLEVSVDMRYLLPEEDNRRIANLSSAEFPSFVLTPGEQFRTTLTRSKEQMDSFTAGYPGLAFIIHTSIATEEALIQPEDAFIPRLEYHVLTGEDGLVFGDIPISGAYVLCHGEGPVLCASAFRKSLTLAASFPGDSREIVENIVRELDHFP